MKLTQRDRVIKKLEQDGEVSNFWAIENYILRLGAIIHQLRLQGWVLDGAFGKEMGREQKDWKNYYYRATAMPPKPKKPVYVSLIDEIGRTYAVRQVA